MSDKESFEAWVSSLGFVVGMQDGSYWAPSVEAMWRGWMASSACHRKRTDGMENLLNEVSSMLSNDLAYAERMQGFRLAMPDELSGFALMLYPSARPSE